MEGVLLAFICGCLEGFEGCLEDVWTKQVLVSRGCPKSVWRVSGGCLEGVWKVSKTCQEGVWKAQIGPLWPWKISGSV